MEGSGCVWLISSIAVFHFLDEVSIAVADAITLNKNVIWADAVFDGTT